MPWISQELLGTACAQGLIAYLLQLVLSEDNIADVQAEYEGPGALLSF